MTAADPQVFSLPALYQQAWRIQQQASDLSGADADNVVKAGAAVMQQCQAAVDQLALFSNNEDADDIATADLKYMLIPAMHGDILAQTQVRDPEVRRHTLQSAVRHYSRFLGLCEQYGLLSKDVKAAARLDGQEPLDQNTKRQQKVQRFKREREIKAKMANVQMKRMHIAHIQDEDGVADDQDEESERETSLLQIELETMKAVEQTQMLQQEVDLLEHAASIPRDQRQQGPRPPPPDVMQHLLGAASNLQGQRQNLQSQVFRPTVALPTVSVEQQGMIELQRMQEAQQKEAAAAAYKAAHEDSDEDSDAKVDKQRAWDDWKDENPSGWGNSKLRPTA